MSATVVSAYWRDQPGPPRRGARLVRPFAAPAVRGLWRVQVQGAAYVPAEGPVMLASNHTSVLDGPLVYAVVRRSVHALVKQEMFDGIVGRALSSLGQIPVDRRNADVAAVKSCLAVLDRGDALAIYPEGTRGAGDFTRIKPGVAYLGLCTGAPIVPVACLGVRRAGSSVGSLPAPRARLDVVFGEPIVLDRIGWPRRRAEVQRQAALLRHRLAEHVWNACKQTGVELPGAAPDWAEQEPEPTVGPLGPQSAERADEFE